MLRRIHLFEFEDQPWVPSAVRDGATDLLDFGFQRAGFYKAALPQLARVLDGSASRRMVDLCSGGGGGSLQLYRGMRSLGYEADLLLTDRFPNRSAMARISALGDPAVRYSPDPMDALSGGGELVGVRTMAGALHHFRPDAIHEILRGVVARGWPLAFFDVAASPALRRIPGPLAPLPIALNTLLLFAASFAAVPFVRPPRLSRLLLSYLVPVIPALVGWDGTVSALRAYEPAEILAIAQGVPGAEAYTWATGIAGRALYLTGIPVETV